MPPTKNKTRIRTLRRFRRFCAAQSHPAAQRCPSVGRCGAWPRSASRDADGPDAADEVVDVLFDYKAGLHDNGEDPLYAARLLSVDGAAGQDDLFFAWHWKSTDDWWWAVDSIQVTANPIPEPTSLMLLACGLLGLLAIRRR